jgi:hypothetical protein
VIFVILVKPYAVFTYERFPCHRILKVQPGDEVVTKDLSIEKVFHVDPLTVFAAEFERRVSKLRKGLQ